MSGLTGVMTKEQLAGLQAGIPVGDYSRIEQAIASVASNPVSGYSKTFFDVGAAVVNAGATKYGTWHNDGVTDDFPNAKLAAVDATATGGVLLIAPPGTTFWNNDNDNFGLAIITKPVIVRGAGRGATIINTPTAALTGVAYLMRTASAGVPWAAMEDLTANGPTTPGANQTAAVYVGGGTFQASRLALAGFVRCLDVATGASIEIRDCDLSTLAASNLACLNIAGGGAANYARMFGTTFHDFGHVGDNQSHGIYAWQSVNLFGVGLIIRTQRGTGYCIQQFGGTGTASYSIFDDVFMDTDTYNGWLTNPTCKSIMSNSTLLCSNRAIITQNDVYLSNVVMSGQAAFCIQQQGATPVSNIHMVGGLLDPAPGQIAIAASIAGTDILTEGVRFTTTFDNAVQLGAGVSWEYPGCKFADTGWGFSQAWFGQGSDGNVTLDGTVTPGWASKVGSVYTLTRTPYLKTLTINNGVTLKTANFQIFCWSFVGLAGSIVDCSGNAAAGATGGALVTGQFFGSEFAGGNGATGAGSAVAVATGYIHLGQPGGAGGTSGGNGGGAAGAVATYLGVGGPLGVPPLAQLYLTGLGISGSTGNVARYAGGNGGGGGGGDGVNAGGGGGGPAGAVVIFASLFNNAGTIRANGGAGAAGVAGNAAGGGGGGGGFVGIFYNSLVAQGTVQVNGGALGAGVGTGANGVVGFGGSTLIQQIR